MNTRDLVKICKAADSRLEAYNKVLSGDCRDGNFKEALYLVALVDKLMDADSVGEP